jgi:hypothetical protein
MSAATGFCCFVVVIMERHGVELFRGCAHLRLQKQIQSCLTSAFGGQTQ